MNTILKLSIGCAVILNTVACSNSSENSKTTTTPATSATKKVDAVAVSMDSSKGGVTASADAGLLKTQYDSVSYMIGQDIGKSFKSMSYDSIISIPVLVAAIEDVIHGRTPKIPESKLKEIQQNFLTEQQKKREAEMKIKGETNIKEGEVFLAANKKKPGVKTTASGLQYIEVKKGTGTKPTTADKVKVHYKGTLIDGKVFDSSYDRGEPAVFGLGQVIPGWTEGIQLMNVGSTYKFFIPSKLGYGERAAGKDIGPNATLIFDVELIAIEK